MINMIKTIFPKMRKLDYGEVFHKAPHHAFLICCFVFHYIYLHLLKFYATNILKRNNFIIISFVEHFGDIVAAEPISRYVKSQYSNSYLVWVVRNRYLELTKHNPYIDKSLVVCCLTESFILEKSKVFDVFLNLHFSDRICLKCDKKLPRLSGDARITFKNYYNKGNLLTCFCRAAGLSPISEGPKVYIPQSCREKIDQFHLPTEFIVIHCKSNEAVRDWTLDGWNSLILKIKEHHDIKVVEVGTASNGTSVDIDLCGRLSILETAEVIRRSVLFVGIDSGPAHLANASSIPGVILIGEFFGFKNYMPYSGRYAEGRDVDLVYEDGPTKHISVERVYECVDRRLSFHAMKPGASFFEKRAVEFE